MSVGSHFTILGTDTRILARAVVSMKHFRKTKAPFIKIIYRTLKTRKGRLRGWFFQRVK